MTDSQDREKETGFSSAVVTGVLIAESLRVGSSLDDVRLTVESISRADAGDETIGQPRTWTLITFEAPIESAGKLARALSARLEPTLGWYCDFRSPDETFVVFAGRVFRYPRGDMESRAKVVAYGRQVGVPEPQLDWPE